MASPGLALTTKSCALRVTSYVRSQHPECETNDIELPSGTVVGDPIADVTKSLAVEHWVLRSRLPEDGGNLSGQSVQCKVKNTYRTSSPL